MVAPILGVICPAIRSRHVEFESVAMILNLFWDLRWFPVNFEIIQWLLMAELYRSHIKADGMRLLLVPPYPGKPLAKQHIRSPDHEWWRVWNLLMPCTRLFPMIKGVHLLANRAETRIYEGPSIPIVFDPEATRAPFKNYNWRYVLSAAENGKLPSITVPTLALLNVRTWLKARAHGRKPVVIALREDKRFPARNSDLPAWSQFVAGLGCEYFPVILRDASAIYSEPLREFQYEGMATFDVASLNVELRAALYQEAHLVMGTMCGNMPLAWFNPEVKYITFTKPAEDTDMPPDWWKLRGFRVGEQPPLCAGPHQKWVWGQDDYKTIIGAFREHQEVMEYQRMIAEADADDYARQMQEAIV